MVSVDVYGDPDATGVCVVPGVMSDAESWRTVAEGLRAWPSVSVVNRRGRAPSTALPPEHSLASEVDDVIRVLDRIGGASAILGWSFGGLVAMLAANIVDIAHVIAYEPVTRPFANDVLPQLAEAARVGDWDSVVETINVDVSGFGAEYVARLRADEDTWRGLRRLAVPVLAELRAVDAEQAPSPLAVRAERIDLILGSRNRAIAPYGTAFDAVRARVGTAEVHMLDGHGHLAHLEAPRALSRLVDAIATAAR